MPESLGVNRLLDADDVPLRIQKLEQQADRLDLPFGRDNLTDSSPFVLLVFSEVFQLLISAAHSRRERVGRETAVEQLRQQPAQEVAAVAEWG